MADKLKTIVVRLKPNHPGGKRNRAGFSFSPKPTAVEVTPEQEETILNDHHLLVITKGTAVKQAMEELKAKGDAAKAEQAPVQEVAEEGPAIPATADEPAAEPVETPVEEPKEEEKPAKKAKKSK